MKVAYVTKNDSSDIHDWSGSTYYINRALNESGIQTVPIGNLNEGYHRFVTRAKKFWYKGLFSKTYQRERNPALLGYLCRQVEASLASIDCDAVFCLGTIPVSYLRSDKPIVFWSDATFAAMVDYYPGFMNLCDETIRNGNEMEQLLLSKCRLAIFNSEWAARSAVKNYDVDPAKVKAVPFGANIECDRDAPGIEKIVSRKNSDTCQLLFVGVEWFRKGGDLAVKVAELLNQRGLKTELHVVGCRPPDGAPDFVKQHGYVSKKTEEGRNFLNGLFEKSHFFILPSRAECCAVVFAEASSFGLPILSTDVGGVATAVRSGRNGQTFPPDADPASYCDYISGLMSAKPEYERLCLSSFREYTERLNWESAGKKVRDLMIEFCGPK